MEAGIEYALSLKSPIIVRWTDVFDGYSFICHQLSKQQYPVTIYALEGVSGTLMRPFPFTLFAHKFR